MKTQFTLHEHINMKSRRLTLDLNSLATFHCVPGNDLLLEMTEISKYWCFDFRIKFRAERSGIGGVDIFVSTRHNSELDC